MKMPLISVVLPIYNIESYLDRCMEAVLNQTYSNLEILMVDDGSPDGCPQICDRYAEQDSRVRALHKENGGLSDARNYGIARARGEYITCIDPDDYVDPDYVEYLYRLIDKYETRMSICQHVTEYDNGSVDLCADDAVRHRHRRRLRVKISLHVPHELHRQQQLLAPQA